MTRWSGVSIIAILLFAALPAQGGELFFSDVRIAMEIQEGSVVVKEMLLLKPEGSADDPNPNGIVVPLPADAEGVELVEDNASQTISLSEGGLLVKGAIPKAGRQFGVLFLLPIKNGEVVFDQSLGKGVKLAHAALVGEVAEADLSGDGFGKSDTGETPNGLPARFIAGKDFKNGHLRITITGLAGNVLYPLTVGLTIISFIVLALGFVQWMRRRISNDVDFE